MEWQQEDPRSREAPVAVCKLIRRANNNGPQQLPVLDRKIL